MRFRAEVESAGNDGRWKIIYVPFSVAEAFGTRGQVKVKGAINGFPFASSLFPTKRGEHFMMINKAMQRGANVDAGEMVEIEFEADRLRPIVMPPALKQALARNKAAQICFAELPDSWKRSYITRMATATGKDVQARRAEVVAERLAELGRGLKQPPAIVKSALAASPVAKQRFARLSPSCKREYIAYILDGVSQETRKRRVIKVIQKLLSGE
jgi:uncharacterized protein YdeI (YjbR/CyaY-like superfamily)